MKTILSILSILVFSLGFGQTAIKKSSISTGGGSATSGNIQVVYTIGETAVQEATQGNIHISEGFIGSDILTSLGVAEYGVLQGVSIFPNPVQDNLQVQWATTGIYELYFYDITGKLIWQQTTSGKQQADYHLTNWKTGVYLLVIIDRNHHQSTHIKIQKL